MTEPTRGTACPYAYLVGCRWRSDPDAAASTSEQIDAHLETHDAR